MFFNGSGFYLIAFAKTGIHRLAFQDEIQKESIQTLSLNGNQFAGISWIGKTDFIYNDQVYDCVSISDSNGKIQIRCVADKEESKVKNLVAESFEKNNSNPTQQKSVKETFKFFPVFPAIKKDQIRNTNSQIQFLMCEFILSSISTPYFEITSPPPELV